MTDDFKVIIPQYVQNIIDTLADKGFESYAVGGCVRDSILGKKPNDWDVTTNALPSEVLDIFEHCIETGVKHGTVGVLNEGKMIEITTYRIDGEYTDSRHPENVVFSRSLKEDLARRDFTINAMAYNNKDGLIDVFRGMADLKNKIIRCVGEADLRFREDALRMMRAVRFAAQLGFEIEDKTLRAMGKNAGLILNISAERVQEEINKILLSDNTECLYILEQTGICGYILPELSKCFKTEQNTKYHIYDVGTHTLKAVEATPKKLNVRLAALMHDFGKPKSKTTDERGADHFYGHPKISVELARDVLNRLRYSNKIKESTLPLVEYHDVQINADKKAVKRMITKVSDEQFLDLLDLKYADTTAQSPAYSEDRKKVIAQLRAIYEEIKQNDEAVKLSDLKINGQDLIELGIDEGREVGRILKVLFDCVIDNPQMNKRDLLIDKVRKTQLGRK